MPSERAARAERHGRGRVRIRKVKGRALVDACGRVERGRHEEGGTVRGGAAEEEDIGDPGRVAREAQGEAPGGSEGEGWAVKGEARETARVRMVGLGVRCRWKFGGDAAFRLVVDLDLFVFGAEGDDGRLAGPRAAEEAQERRVEGGRGRRENGASGFCAERKGGGEPFSVGLKPGGRGARRYGRKALSVDRRPDCQL